MMVLIVLLSWGMEDWDWVVRALGFPRSAFGLSSGIHSSGILGDTSDTGRHCFRHRVPRGSWSYVPNITLHLVAYCAGNDIDCSLSQPRVTTGSFGKQCIATPHMLSIQGPQSGWHIGQAQVFALLHCLRCLLQWQNGPEVLRP